MYKHDRCTVKKTSLILFLKILGMGKSSFFPLDALKKRHELFPTSNIMSATPFIFCKQSI